MRHRQRRAAKPYSSGGFTLIELLVVVAIMGILSALLLPSLGKAKLKAQGLMCMSNHRQLTMAWKMWTDDNRDELPYASEYPIPGHTRWTQTYPQVWVHGYMDFNPDNRSNWDVEEDIKKSPLWRYCGNSAAIWKCPADKSSVTVNGQALPRVRSMSMNLWVGGFGGTDGMLSDGFRGADRLPVVGGSTWKVFLRMSDMVNPGPARTFVLLDMREDSIDIGNFATDMRGWPDNPARAGFYDFPGSYHNRAGGLSFADGHSEIKRWRDDRTMPPLERDGLIPDVVPSPNNKDVIWLQERATRRN